MTDRFPIRPAIHELLTEDNQNARLASGMGNHGTFHDEPIAISGFRGKEIDSKNALGQLAAIPETASSDDRTFPGLMAGELSVTTTAHENGKSLIQQILDTYEGGQL